MSHNTYPEGGSDDEDYYAFTWGDVLFIVLDTFRYTTFNPVENGLDKWTLGTSQLQWLESTLQSSTEEYKFAFIHHLVGGCNGYGRGGAQCANNGEWGYAVHPLLVQYNVDAVFHGHDHAFIDEILDGIRYTLVPTPTTVQTEFAWRDFYDTEKIIGNPGHIRVDIDNCVTVQYISSSDTNNGQAIYSYHIPGSNCPDTDKDGISDEDDNCPVNFNPDQEDTFPPQGNGIGDTCECEADFDCDQDVDSIDATMFIADFGRSIYLNPCTNIDQCHGDFTCDSDVDRDDVTKFLEDFGRNLYNNPCPVCTLEIWCEY